MVVVTRSTVTLYELSSGGVVNSGLVRVTKMSIVPLLVMNVAVSGCNVIAAGEVCTASENKATEKIPRILSVRESVRFVISVPAFLICYFGGDYTFEFKNGISASFTLSLKYSRIIQN